MSEVTNNEPASEESARAFFGDYRARGVRKICGPDGYMFSATIYEGARKIANAINHGTGGDTILEFMPAPNLDEIKQRFNDHVASLSLGEYCSRDIFVDELLNLAEGSKNVQAFSRNRKSLSALFEDGVIYSFKLKNGVSADHVNKHIEEIKGRFIKDNPELKRFLLDMSAEELETLAMVDTYRSHCESRDRFDALSAKKSSSSPMNLG